MAELVYFTKPTFIKEITDSAINVEIELADVTLFTFACFLAGYLISVFSSSMEKIFKKMNLYPKIPKSIAEKFSPVKDHWHYIKDYTEANVKIEEYYIRYAQARNMLGSLILCILGSIFCMILQNADSILVCLLLGNLLLTMLMSYAYHRQRRRYYQVFLAEFCKQYNEKNSNNTIPLNSLY